MKVLAFDQATETGWAVVEDGKLIDYGRITFKGTKYTGDNKRYNYDIMHWSRRCAQIKNFILNKIEEIRPDLVVIEGIQNNNNHDTHTKLAALLGVISAACYEKEINYVVYRIPNWKKDAGIPTHQEDASGKKRKVNRAFEKAYAQRLSNELFGVQVTQDEADAIMMAYAADKHTER
jgi:Holliday junction resolvasome RuvABC endonuclease subunit